jgi:histidinol-phosphate aminotransferase
MSTKTLITPYSGTARAISTRLMTTHNMVAWGRCHLDGCENDRVSPAALDAVRGTRPEHLVLHWDAQDPGLRADLAAMHGVDAGQVFVCAGAIDAIRTAFDVFGPPARTIGLLTPDWPGFRCFADRTGAAVVTLDRMDFPHHADVHDVVTFCADNDVDMAVVSNPSAVTGRRWHPDEVSELLSGAPGTMFVIDEAHSIHPDRSSARLTTRFDNVIVVGSLSNFLGLSGLRVGFVVAPDSLRPAFAAAVDHLGLTSVAIAASRAAIGDVDYQRETRRGTEENLSRLTSALRHGPYFVTADSESLTCYLTADDSVPDPYASLNELGIDLVPGSLFGLSRGGRLNLRSRARVDQLILALDRLATSTAAAQLMAMTGAGR